jgi:surface polysaccharide O-acyltransferase-like enzyme
MRLALPLLTAPDRPDLSASTASTAKREHVAAFDVLRSVAAVAVVVIHVLRPYRDQLGEIPDAHWMSAVTLNGLSRWCVPTFIMITGALMLADPRAFAVGYYLRHRVSKVLIPFVVWSLLYAVLAGFTRGGFDATETITRLVELPTHETYYHLGFFYYFIPLYLVIPVLLLLVKSGQRGLVITLTAAWLALTTLYLLDAEGVLGMDIVMYGGYLLLGYVLFTYRPLPVSLLALLALGALVITNSMVITESLDAERYQVARWFSYKTLNTVVVASFVFVGALAYAAHLSARALAIFEFVARHSLGIFLIHPIFLWPVHEFELFRGHPLVVVPLWTLVCGGLALLTSWWLRSHRASAWLVP